MTKIEKIISSFLREPPDVRFEDVVSVLEWFGYSKHTCVGSHHTFAKVGAVPITVPTISGRKVKKVYVRRIIELLGLEEWHENEH